jgi:preprotein translocase subunit SecA
MPRWSANLAALWRNSRPIWRPGSPREPDWRRYSPLVEQIRRRQADFLDQDEPSLNQHGRDLQNRGQSVERMIDAMALACVAARRTLGIEPFDVQIVGALVMHDQKIAEMQTGEGKTLAAVLTVCANALDGTGVHVWTANDYLARRDAQWMGPIYRSLGLSVGFVTQGMSASERHAAYACDVTYATPNEIGFDLLRDGLALYPTDLTQRAFDLALIDEIDAILIDEARIPLVIAGESAGDENLAGEMARIVARFEQGTHYTTDEYGRDVRLTDIAVAEIEDALRCGNLFDLRNLARLTAAQDAVHAKALLRRDVDYVVKDHVIESVDEFKGRIAQNRRWPAGLQTALEAKEGLPLTKQGRILGSVTVQYLSSLYRRLCGMTGTAATQWEEFRQIYDLEVVVVPTNRPVVRVDLLDGIFETKAEKEKALVEEILRVHSTGKPILVGTASVAESEHLSTTMSRAGVSHQVLNAKNDEAEAAIVARAGHRGQVTISTNMALT